jgi:hypothetical protein
MPEVPGQAEAEAKWGPKLPGAVKAQVAAAEALYQPQDPNAPPAEAGSPDPNQPQPQPAPPVPPGQPPQPQPTPPPPAQEDPNAQTWEQRFRSSQGRLEQAQAQLAAQAERLGNMETLLATMQAQGVQQPVADGTNAKTFERLVTPEEENDYGKDLLTVVGKRAREEFAPEVETLRERLDRIEGRVQGTSEVISRNQISEVYDVLHRNIGPDWVQLNQFPDFKDRWLKEVDPYAGRPRGDLLKEAFDRRDGQRVLRFFQGYLSEAAPDTQGAQPTPPPNGAPPSAPPNGRVPLETFAAPGRARSEPQGHLPPGKPTYTRAQLQQFWNEKRQGKWRGREADAEAIEQDIFRAQHEGRIV